MGDVMTQVAPYPMVLRELLDVFRYRAGYRFALEDDYDRGQGSVGLTLIINITGPNAYHPTQFVSVNHLFPVPPAAYDVRSWRRWLFDRIGDVDDHERCEWFMVGDDRPYAPSHGPGNDPYLIREVGTLEDQRTSFRGEVAADPRTGR
jgi:hypothetical protein